MGNNKWVYIVLGLILGGMGAFAVSAYAATTQGNREVVTISDTNEFDLVSTAARLQETRGTTFFMFCTQDGTAKVYYTDFNDNDREIRSQDYTASTLLVLDFDFRIPDGKLTFTSDVGSGTCTGENALYR